MSCHLALDIDPAELANRRDSILERIYTRVEVQDLGFVLDGQPSPCHIWTGPDSGDGRGGGYGRMSLNSQTVAVHPLLRLYPRQKTGRSQMQSKTLLQPFTSGIDVPSPQSAAACQASQRDHLKPSQCKVGDVFYRYEGRLVSAGVDQWDESLGSYMYLYCHEYRVEDITPKGAKIAWHNRDGNWAPRPVMDHYINKYAYPTKVEALLGFMARKKRQQAILFGHYSRSRQAEQKAEQLLAKEMQ